MSKQCVMGFFSDFDEAFSAIAEIRDKKIDGVSIDDVTLKSPIEHPEIEEVLGERPVHISKFTLLGATFGVSFGFLFLSGAQATFLVQPQGGKPVIPLPSNFVLMYEMLIFFAVWFTVISFIVLSGLVRKPHSLYSEKVSLDQVGILLELDKDKVASVRDLFNRHKVLEIREEAIA
ncbi:MAG: quinol:electron acceptor oxidoreductase subunit ActD [Thiohalomonadales bacterium]